MPPLTHSERGASKAERWINCPGSVVASRGRPVRPPSKYALEGTAAHALAERCLMDCESPKALIGETVEGFEVTGEMAECVEFYVSAIRSRCVPGSRLYIERSLDGLSKYFPGLHCTTDCMILSADGRHLVVGDYKHGQGKVVLADSNSQLLYCAASALELPECSEVETVEMFICQPRVFGKKLSHETAKATEIRHWRDALLLPAAFASEKADAPRKCGTWCDWCPASGDCPQQLKETEDAAMVAFDKVDQHVVLPQVSSLPLDVVARILKSEDQLETFMSACRNRVRSELDSGNPVPGWKLVQAQSKTRMWREGPEVVETLKFLGPEAWTTELKSPAQMEKAIRAASKMTAKQAAEIVAPLVVRGAPTIQMVESEDDRPAALAGADDAFKQVPASSTQEI